MWTISAHHVHDVLEPDTRLIVGESYDVLPLVPAHADQFPRGFVRGALLAVGHHRYGVVLAVPASEVASDAADGEASGVRPVVEQGLLLHGVHAHGGHLPVGVRHEHVVVGPPGAAPPVLPGLQSARVRAEPAYVPVAITCVEPGLDAIGIRHRVSSSSFRLPRGRDVRSRSPSR